MKNSKKIAIVPLADRVLLKIKLVENRDEKGQKFMDLSREASVLSMGRVGEFVDQMREDGVKVGSNVYYNPRGCINIETMKTKTHVFILVDACDVYGLLK